MEVSPARVALKWGLLTALVEILMTSIRYALGYYFSFWFPFLTFLILVTGQTLAMRELRAQQAGFMSYTEGLSLGVQMFALIGLLDTTYTMIYNTFVNPDVVLKTLAQMQEFMQSLNMPDEQMDRFEEQMKTMVDVQRQKGVSGVNFITGIFGWIFWGFVLSLIVSGIIKNNDQRTTNNEQ
jgi:tetrahydromethanopterin S-methyltransferase subunit B